MCVSPLPDQENLYQSELHQLDENGADTCCTRNQETENVAKQRDRVQQNSCSDCKDLQQSNEIVLRKDLFYVGIHHRADGCVKITVVRGSKLPNRI